MSRYECTAIIVLFHRPANIATWLPWTALALLAIAWGSTAFLQVPRHNELAACYADAAQCALCCTNWLGTVAWSARALLMTLATSQAI